VLQFRLYIMLSVRRAGTALCHSGVEWRGDACDGVFTTFMARTTYSILSASELPLSVLKRPLAKSGKPMSYSIMFFSNKI
jgi:hypothetical protein